MQSSLLSRPSEYAFGLPVGVDKQEWIRQWRDYEKQELERKYCPELYMKPNVYRYEAEEGDDGLASPSVIEFCGDGTPSAISEARGEGNGILEPSYDLPAGYAVEEPKPSEKIWSTVPSIKPSTHPQWHKTIHRWCFSCESSGPHVEMVIFEVELFNKTILRHTLYTSQIKEVLTLSKRDDPLHRVILDVFAGGMFWTPTQIAYKFMEPENSLAFQMSLTHFLSIQRK